MTKASSRKYRGLDDDVRNLARLEARRSGKRLGAWLDDVIREAEEDGEDEASERERIEAIARRLARSGGVREELLAEARRERDEDFWEGEDERPRRPRRRAWGGAARLDRDDESVAYRGAEEEGLALLARRLGRLEAQLAERRGEHYRSALSRLESRLESLSPTDRDAELEEGLNGLGPRLADMAQTTDVGKLAARGRSEVPPEDAESLAGAPKLSGRPGETAHAPLPEAGSQQTSRAPRSARFAVAQASLDSISHELETVKQFTVERADQQLVSMRQIEGLRRELRDMSEAIGELAPRASIAAIETALHDLARRVEAQRYRGVGEDLLAPVERVAGELRAVMRDLDPSPIVRNLHADVLTIGRRLDALEKPNAADAALVEQLAASTGEIREQLAALAARPLPLEKIETRLVDLTQRVDAFARVSAAGAERTAAALDLSELTRSIRAIVSSETNASFDTFNSRLEQLAGRLDDVVANAGGKRIDELGRRIDDLGQMLSKRLDGERADSSELEKLVAGLAVKLDTAFEKKTDAPALEEIGRKISSLESRLPDAVSPESIARIENMLANPQADRRFQDLAQRIDELRETLSQRFEQASSEGSTIAALESLLRALDRKVETALAAGGREPDVESIHRQLEQLSQKVDRLDDPSANPKLTAFLAASPRAPQMNEIAGRLERVQTSLAQRAEEGSRIAARQDELNHLVRQLAARIDQAAGAQADAEALKALEAQIGALSRRLDRNDHNGAALAAIEAKIAALVAQIEDTKSATSRAAEEAVRRATQEMLREASPEPGALRATLERELSNFRENQNESGQRTQETLRAVHETLERVVDRLSTFEGELNEIRSAPKAARPAAEARDDDDLDGFLMPPGFSRPSREAEFATALAGARAETKQMDFIAAARRAAEQAARDAEAAEIAHKARRAAREEAAAEAEEREAAGKSGAVAAVQDRKRPLLLGLGALVLMIGAYQVTRVGIEGAEKWTHHNHHATATPTEAGSNAAAPAVDSSAGEGPKSPASAGPDAAAPESPAPPPPRMLAPHAGLPVDRTPVGSIGPAALQPAPATDVISHIQARAGAGDKAAQYELALRLAEGRGLSRDPHAAAQWFEKAAAQGLAPAQYRLGSLYEKGVGVGRDYARARKFYQSAAEAGNARAMHNLAVLLAEGGEGGKPDYAGAAEWFRKGGEYGIRDSQYNLAILYARGLGVGQSLVQSYVWFSAAAAQGDADAAKKRDEVAARLDSRELAAAKAAAAAFHVKEPPREANEVTAPAGGWEKANVPAVPEPLSKPPAKPKMSAI